MFVNIFCVNVSLQKLLLTSNSLVLCGAVMKKTSLALTILFTVSIFFGVQFANLVEANWIPSGPYITVVLPTNYGTYDIGSTILLNVTVRESFGVDSTEVEYCLDGKENITLPTVVKNYSTPSGIGYVLSSTVSLSELSEGVHSITVYARGVSKMTNWNTKNSTICFFRIGESESFPTSTPEGSLISEPNFSFYAYLEDPHFVAMAIMAFIIVVVFAVFLFYMRKHKH